MAIMPFFLGFQGSGEPLVHFETLKRIYQQVRSLTRKHRLILNSFITSNGCMAKEYYKWIAERFDRICLSIDGDKKLHDLHRNTQSGSGTYSQVVKTLSFLHNQGTHPVVRITVTRYNADFLPGIVNHLVKDLHIYDIQVEPVYFCESLYPEAGLFVENFVEAKQVAAAQGAVLRYSGYRKNEKHGPYCNVNRNVLYVGPKGTASICLFKDQEDKQSPFVIASYEPECDRIFFQNEKIKQLKKHASQLYVDCRECDLSDSCV